MESEPLGYYYTVTPEQIKEHQQRSFAEILQWLDSTRLFIDQMRTPEEREIARKLKNKKITLD